MGPIDFEADKQAQVQSVEVARRLKSRYSTKNRPSKSVNDEQRTRHHPDAMRKMSKIKT
jgi:hypothetical protein